ncbi:MAG: sugar transferase [Acidobacteriota bacterium]
MYRKFLKRFLDIVLSAAGLVTASPIMLAVAAAIYFEDRGKVIFRQKRIGSNGAVFEVLKFRSMPENTDDVESAKATELPITKVGRFIRRTNLDELPQLINVIRGDMSLVGPRPPIPSQLGLCRLRESNGSIACRPGMTGLAQINGYDGMPDEEKARWDGKYAETLGLVADAKIVLKTFGYLKKKPPVY